MTLIEYESRAAWAEGLAAELAGQIADALSISGKATFIAAGGSTPLPVYRKLSCSDIDWGRVAIVPSDERCVPEQSPRSNLGMIKSNLLQGHAVGARAVPLFEEGLESGDSELTRKTLDGLLPPTACLLGMGEDLHTASLFPGAAGLELAMSDDAPPVLPVVAPSTGERRMTLTLRVLASSKFIHIAILGGAKYEALERASAGADPLHAPVAALLERARVHYCE